MNHLSYFLLTRRFKHEHPYISAMIGNGSVHYDHDQDGTLSQVAGCSVSTVIGVIVNI